VGLVKVIHIPMLPKGFFVNKLLKKVFQSFNSIHYFWLVPSFFPLFSLMPRHIAAPIIALCCGKAIDVYIKVLDDELFVFLAWYLD